LGIAAYGEEKVTDFLKDVTAKGEAKRGDVAKMKKEFRTFREYCRQKAGFGPVGVVGNQANYPGGPRYLYGNCWLGQFYFRR